MRFNNRREIVSKWSFFHHRPEEFQIFILNLNLHRLPIIFLVSPSPCDTFPKFPKQGYLHHSIILYTAVGAGNYSCGINEAGSCRTPALFTSGKKAIRTHGWYKRNDFFKNRDQKGNAVPKKRMLLFSCQNCYVSLQIKKNFEKLTLPGCAGCREKCQTSRKLSEKAQETVLLWIWNFLRAVMSFSCYRMNWCSDIKKHITKRWWEVECHWYLSRALLPLKRTE